jgi:hypothetical protein
MALYDMVYGMNDIAAGSSLTIRPSVAGEVWRIHNIYSTQGITIEIYRSDSISTTPTLMMFRLGTGLYSNPGFLCNQDEFLVVKNVGTVTTKISFDGTVVKVS